MQAVGITGGIASGKSTVLQLFAQWGATVIDSDAVSRRCSQPGTAGYIAIVELFGPAVVLPSGELDRPTLAARILADPQKKEALEKILHPRIMAHLLAELEKARRAGTKILVVEVPLLFEAAVQDSFQRTVCVVSSPDLQRARLLQRGVEPALIERWLESQWPEARKAELADFVIRNDGDRQQLEARSRAVFEELLEEADEESAARH